MKVFMTALLIVCLAFSASASSALLPDGQQTAEGVIFKVFRTENRGYCEWYYPAEETRAMLGAYIDGFSLKRVDFETIAAHPFSGLVVCRDDVEYYIHSDGFVEAFSLSLPSRSVAEGQTAFCELALSTAREKLGLSYFFDPATITDVVSATYAYQYFDLANGGSDKTIAGSQTIAEPEKLEALCALLRGAEQTSAGCPFQNLLTLTKSDGTAITIAVATDSCATFFVNGQCFNYKSRQNSDVRAHDWFDEIPKGVY